MARLSYTKHPRNSIWPKQLGSLLKNQPPQKIIDICADELCSKNDFIRHPVIRTHTKERPCLIHAIAKNARGVDARAPHGRVEQIWFGIVAHLNASTQNRIDLWVGRRHYIAQRGNSNVTLNIRQRSAYHIIAQVITVPTDNAKKGPVTRIACAIATSRFNLDISIVKAQTSVRTCPVLCCGRVGSDDKRRNQNGLYISFLIVE